MNEEILKRLDALAARLSTTVDHLWGVLILQSRIAAVQDISLLVMAAVAGFFVFRWGRWVVREDADEFIWIPIAFLSVGIATVAACSILQIPTELFNPEYFALHSIMEGFK